LQKNNIIKNKQNGIREGKSTEKKTHAFFENIQKKKKKKINLIGFFFYLSKAYDLLDHKMLLFKLDTYGIRGLVNQLFKSYLCNQKQYVETKYMENIIRI
jgi:hypothetical protein